MSRPPSSTERAVGDLYAASYARLVGVTALAAGSRAEAEDAVQEAFIRLLARWDQIAHYEDPEGWVRSVAFRLLSNRRRQARNGVRALGRLGAAPASPAPSGDAVDIARALASLPVGQRAVVVLHHLVGLSVDDVATALDLPSGTVKSRLSRSRATLAPLLREETSRA